MREMKDSGVEWIGEIPKDWKICRFKNICNIFTGNSIKDEEKELYEDAVNAHPYIATKDIDAIYCKPNYNNGLYVNNLDFSFKIAPKCSTLMCIEGGSAGRKKARINQEVSFVNKLCCFYSKSQENRFLYYYLCSPNYESEFSNNLSGLIGGVSVSVLKNIKYILPPIETQHRIADYLDNKCSKIDEIIEKQQQIIEKLKAYKQSVITEAVDHKEEWSNCHLGYLAQFKNGLNYNGNADNTEIKFLNVGDFQQYFELNNIDMFSSIKFNGIMPDDLLLKNGDIVFVRSNGSKELVGRSVLINNVDFPLTYSGFCIRMRNKRQDIVLSKFLMYFFSSSNFRQILNRDSRGSNINNLNQALLSKLEISFPTIFEQQKIADFLDCKCSQIDKSIEAKQKIIEKLTDYKKSLIYEVVTGKTEVS